jgi:FtsH-binding integral membrane protein
MDVTLMLRTACALLALGAIGGVGMAAIRFTRGVNPPAAFAMAHGLLAAAGITLLAYADFTGPVPSLAWISLVLLLAAAGIGAWLNLAYQWRQRTIPAGLTFVHIGAAVAGFLCLLVAALTPMAA